MATEKKPCFVISPIGEDGSEIRKRADLILRYVVTPSLNECGYEPIRADKISEPGLITSQIIQHIIEDPLVIADLTGSNPNVFYELALRHAIRRPLVQIIKKGDKLPFDLAGMRTIPVDHNDLESVDEAKSEIVKQIRAAEGKKPEEIESPISVAIQLQQLKSSENPEERSLAELLALVNEVRTDLSGKLASLDKRLSDPTRLLPPGYVASIIREQTESSRISGTEFFKVCGELGALEQQLKRENERSEKKNGDKAKEIRRLEERIGELRVKADALRVTAPFSWDWH